MAHGKWFFNYMLYAILTSLFVFTMLKIAMKFFKLLFTVVIFSIFGLSAFIKVINATTTTTKVTSIEQCGWSYYDRSNCNESCILEGSTCKPVENTNPQKYHCCNNYFGTKKECSRCSDTYIYCNADWESTEGCTDTWNAKYTLNCNCDGTSGSSQYATKNCSEKGVDTSSCNTLPECNTRPTNCTECDPDQAEDGKCKNNSRKQCSYTAYKDPNDPNAQETTNCKESDERVYETCSINKCTSSQTCNESTGICESKTTTTTHPKTTTTKSTTSTTASSTTTTASSSTTTTIPNKTILEFVIGLDGIGTSGDTPNPEDKNCTETQRQEGCGSNQNPNTKDRNLNIEIISQQGSFAVSEKLATITYDSATGKFKGSAELENITSGTYVIKVKSPGFLRKTASQTQVITSGQKNTVPTTRLINGNVNEDNLLDIRDYNILVSCSTFSKDNNETCKSGTNYQKLSDLDDNSVINEYDYNLLIRELPTGQGE